MMRAVVLGLVLAALAAGRARAQPPERSAMTDEARAHWERGLSEHAARHYPAASAEFAACYRLAQRRECLFAWAQAARLAGDCESASALYRRYLQAELSPRQAEAAHHQLALCEAELAARTRGRGPRSDEPRVTASPRVPPAQPAAGSGVEPARPAAPPAAEPGARTTPPATEPRASPAPPAAAPRARTTPQATEPRASPAPPAAAPRARTTPPATEPRASPARPTGEPGAARAPPPADLAAPAEVPPRPPWYRDRWGDALAGAGVAAVAAGALLYVSARRDAASSAPTYDSYAEHVAGAERARGRALAAFGVGSALIATGVIHMIVREGAARPAAAAPAPRIDLVLDGTHLAVGYTGAF